MQELGLFQQGRLHMHAPRRSLTACNQEDALYVCLHLRGQLMRCVRMRPTWHDATSCTGMGPFRAIRCLRMPQVARLLPSALCASHLSHAWHPSVHSSDSKHHMHTSSPLHTLCSTMCQRRYVTVDERAGRALFYVFVTSSRDPVTDPLLLWLNGCGASLRFYACMNTSYRHVLPSFHWLRYHMPA